MQARSKSSIPVSGELKEIVKSLKHGSDTYTDVLSPIINAAALSDKEDGIGVVFLKTVYLGDELKTLKKPIPLTLSVDTTGSLILSNNEFKLLVVCDNLVEGLEEARLEFARLIDIYAGELPMTKGAVEFGKKLMSVLT